MPPTTTTTRTILGRLLFFLLISLTPTVLLAREMPTIPSVLWGLEGEAWNLTDAGDDGGMVLLRDFTNVGYRNGNVSIPNEDDWPTGVNVLDFGAIPDDDEDDSQAFLDAIAACPPYSAVYVPNGKYIILQQIRVDRDYFVLRGQDMFQTILYFPKYLGEIYPAVRYDDSYGYKGGFFHVDGGTHRSIENLTFEFRPQTKMGFWEFRGGNAIKYKGGISDSWIRNIHFRNVDFGVEFDDADRVSVLNLYFDHYVGRPAFVSAAFYIRTAAYLGIGMGKMYECLIHNIVYTGDMFHDFDIINVPSYNVISNVRGPSVELRHHGTGAHHNLYTEAYCGKGFGAHGLNDARFMHHETHWGIHRGGDRALPIHPDANFTRALNSYHVFVGYAVDYPSTSTPTFYYENIDPAFLTPKNIYVAQMEYRGKPLPEDPPLEPPQAPDLVGDVRILNPTDDVAPGNNQNPDAVSIPFNGYLKFDLSELEDLDTIEHVRFRICTRARRDGTAFNVTVASVANDEWTQDTLNATNQPEVGSVLDHVYIEDTDIHKWWDFNVTDFVRSEWENDKIVTLYMDNDMPRAYLGGFHSRESGNAPQLVIERVPSLVPGPPAAPTGMETRSDNGHILLDWDDNTEADFAYYNVYRTPAPNAGHPIAQGLTMSEFMDISATEDRGLCEMPNDIVYVYTVTAVDDHGYESAHSTEFVGCTLHESNEPPVFVANMYNMTNDTFTFNLTDAVVDEYYNASIADMAMDPESDSLYFFKVSGPAWLNVDFDGTLSGIPRPTEGELMSSVVIQVNAIGGHDKAEFELMVLDPNNDAPSFTKDLIMKTNAIADEPYVETLANDAMDPDSDPMTFSKISGSAWLNVASDGSLSGTPSNADVGLNSFLVEVRARGGVDTATLEIMVDAATVERDESNPPTASPTMMDDDDDDDSRSAAVTYTAVSTALVTTLVGYVFLWN